MKKRKELDALVPNGKVKKKAAGGGGGGSASSHELLRVDSDTTDTEEFTVVQARKTPSKKSGWLYRMCTACAPVCTLTLVTACVVGSGILLWMQFGIRQEVDLLRDHLRQVEESNKGTSSEFHNIHSQLNGLQKNHTALKDGVAQLNRTLEAMLAEVATLAKTAEDLQKSVAAAPQLTALPNNVDKVLKDVALMGSQITSLQSNFKQVKDQLGNNDKEQQKLQGGVNALKTKVDALAAEQRKLSEIMSKSSTGNADISKLMDTLVETNNSIWQKLQWSVEDLHEHHNVITDLQALVQNLTQHIANLEASPLNVTSIMAAVVQEARAQVKSLINATLEPHILPNNLPNLGDANGTVTIETLLSYVRGLTQLYVALVAKSQVLPAGQLHVLNDTLNINLVALVQDTVSGYVNFTVNQQDAKIKELLDSIAALNSSYYTVKQSSDTLKDKMAALREQIGKMPTANHTLPQATIVPVQQLLPIPTTKTSLGPNTEQIQNPAPNFTVALNESLAATASVTAASTPILAPNSTMPGNSSATLGHIQKPIVAGGSLPDEDGAPKSGSVNNGQ